MQRIAILSLALGFAPVRASLSQGQACTTTATGFGSNVVPCDAGLKCVITDPGRPEVDVPNSGTCEPESCTCGQTCTMPGGGSGMCFQDGTCAVTFMAVQCPLHVGDVCHSGGVETGAGVNRRDDCPPGSSCRANGGMAIGGEVTSTCQLDQLQLGDVCKSGGVETGPGVDRAHDCPIGSVCSPRTDVAGIGGEVPSTCQAHDNPLPLGGVCTTSGTLLTSATTCKGDLVCILIDAGRLEVDVPNRGLCMPAAAALPLGASCADPLDTSHGIGALRCAPTLSCKVSQGARPEQDAAPARTCQPTNGANAGSVPTTRPPPMIMDDGPGFMDGGEIMDGDMMVPSAAPALLPRCGWLAATAGSLVWLGLLTV